MAKLKEFTVTPDPNDQRLVERVTGTDHDNNAVTVSVTVERALTLYLNSREIVTMMTIGDFPEYLAVGYLVNQNMLSPEDTITGIDYEEDIETVVVRTEHESDFEEKLTKKTLTSGCAMGTVFGDLMEKFDEVDLPDSARLKTSDLFTLLRKINTAPSL